MTKEKSICPVCGALEEVDLEYKKMCDRCFWFLAPSAGGVDFGYLMYRTSTHYDGLKSMEIRPRGFWADSIKVYQKYNRKSGIWVDVSWSSGGADGSLDSIKTAESFQKALAFAVDTAKAWEKEVWLDKKTLE